MWGHMPVIQLFAGRQRQEAQPFRVLLSYIATGLAWAVPVFVLKEEDKQSVPEPDIGTIAFFRISWLLSDPNLRHLQDSTISNAPDSGGPQLVP